MRISLVLLGLVFFFNSFNSRASHAAGGYFEYNYLGENNYEVFFYLLRDCSGVPMGDFEPELYRKSDCGNPCTNLGTMTFMSNSYVDFGCGNTCDNTSFYPGFELYKYRRVVTLPSACDSWSLHVAVYQRNAVSYNFSTGALGIFCRINTANGHYNSPQIIGANMIVGCTDNTAQSLFTIQPAPETGIICSPYPSLQAVISGATHNCLYAPDDVDFPYNYPYDNGLSYTNPYYTTNYTVNQVNGLVSFTPTVPGTSFYSIVARTYNSTGILVGEIQVEGMIVIANCPQNNTINFGTLPNSSYNDVFERTIFDDNCRQFLVSSNNGAPIMNLDYQASAALDVSYVELTPSLYQFTVCMNYDNEHPQIMCEDNLYTVTVSAETTNSTDCLGEANGLNIQQKNYSFYRPKAEGCAENVVVTNINNSSSVQSVEVYKAQDRIWVGDDFPAGITTVPAGPVNFTHDVTFIAGIEVVNPSCIDGGTGCVTFDGNTNVTEMVIANHCSTECIEPLDLCVKPVFKCGNESILVDIEGGIAPFSVYVYVNDIQAGFEQNLASFPISVPVHSVVSSFNGNLTYYVMVVDAAGQSHISANFNINGTNRFYKPIEENMIPSVVTGQPVYLLNAMVRDYLPVVFLDDVNSEPPYYGATWYELLIINRWGEVMLHEEQSLESTSTWSFDNGQIFWNGHSDNNLNANCFSGTSLYPTKLKARNCASAAVYIDCLEDMTYTDECGGVTVQDCFNQNVPWNGFTDELGNQIYYVFAGNYEGDEQNNGYTCDEDFGRMHTSSEVLSNKEHNAILSSQQRRFFNHGGSESEEIVIFPNPTMDEFSIFTNGELYERVILYDVNGRFIQKLNSENSSYDLSFISNGAYFIKIEWSNGMISTHKIIKY